MSAEARGYPPIILWMLKDCVLGPNGANLLPKHHRWLPLPVVGGGVPITRH